MPLFFFFFFQFNFSLCATLNFIVKNVLILHDNEIYKKKNCFEEKIDFFFCKHGLYTKTHTPHTNDCYYVRNFAGIQNIFTPDKY